MKKIIATFLLIVLTANIGFAQMNTTPNNEVNNINKEEIQNLIDTYQEDINKIIKKEKTTLEYNTYHQETFKIYGMESSRSDSNYTNYLKQLGRIEIPLCDGDYVVWNSKVFDKEGLFSLWTWKGRKSVQYAGEYHQDKSLMGIIKIKRINRKTIAFYEYRLNENRDLILNLKHIMIYYHSKNPVTFVATVNGEIKGIRYKDMVLSAELSNISDIEKIDLSSIDNPNIVNDVLNIAAHGLGTTVGVAGAIALIPLGLVVFPVLAGGLIINEKREKE